MIQIHDDKDGNTTVVVFMALRLLRGIQRPRIHDNYGSFILDAFFFVTKIHDDDNESDNNTWMSFCDDYSAADFGLAAVFGGSVAVRRPSRVDALLCFGAVFGLAADFGFAAVWTALYFVCFNPRTRTMIFYRRRYTFLTTATSTTMMMMMRITRMMT